MISMGGSSKPSSPAPARMPVESDPSVLAAAERAKMDMMRRRGRQSTILTDSLSSRTNKLGSGGGVSNIG